MPARQIHDVFCSLSYQFCTYKISGMEEKKYCIFCGAENDADADVCCWCGKSMHEKDHLLKEYLYKKTKGRLKGKLEDSFLSVLKNWIFSHLYGLVVTVSLIAAVVFRITASAAVPEYVRTVTYEQRPDIIAMTSQSAMQGTSSDTQSASAETAETAVPEQEEDPQRLTELVDEYELMYVMETFETGEEFLGEHAGQVRESSAAYMVPAEYGYPTVNEYYDPIFHGVSEIHSRYTDTEIVFNQPETETGSRIHVDGHTVAEFMRTYSYTDQDERDLGSVSYRIVMCRLDGEWYIAEMTEVEG